MMAVDQTVLKQTLTKEERWEKQWDYVPGGEYIGNCHTGIFHLQGCGDIDKMKKEHKVPTDNEKGVYRGCGHCKPVLWKFNKVTSKEDTDDTEICDDPKVAKIFEGLKCSCGSTDGIIKMKPHFGGVKLLKKPGKWWIWRECFKCEHQLSLTHALEIKLSNKKNRGI